MNDRAQIKAALEPIFQGIEMLQERFPEKAFTVDGRLVGDIGEIIATLEYDFILFDVQTPRHDGETSDGRKVQVTSTFKDSLSITAVPELYLGLQLFEDGSHAEVFNGPGSVIAEKHSHRRGFGERQLSFPATALRELSNGIPSDQKIPRRSFIA
jgi:hypothetical protein